MFIYSGIARGDELSTVWQQWPQSYNMFIYSGIARGDELSTVWQQWPQSNDLDLLFCARDSRDHH